MAVFCPQLLQSWSKYIGLVFDRCAWIHGLNGTNNASRSLVLGKRACFVGGLSGLKSDVVFFFFFFCRGIEKFQIMDVTFRDVKWKFDLVKN